MKARLARIGFLVLAFTALATIAPAPPPPLPPGPGQAALFATSLRLDRDNPERRRLGPLHFRRGWQLTSPDPRFGGLSAMQVQAGKVTALSDSGVIIEFALPGGSGDFRGEVQFTPLLGPGPASRKSNRDTEALVLADGQAWVGFERHNMIWRYRSSDWRALAASRPAILREWPGNAGPESLVALGDGRFIAIAEGMDEAEFSDAALFDGNPADPATASTSFRYRRLEGLRPTDAALLGPGRLLVLNRSITLFGGMVAKLAIVDLADARSGGTVSPRTIATFRSPVEVDNMEALSVNREQGRTIVRIASDDNFLPLQRTLLLEFELDENVK